MQSSTLSPYRQMGEHVRENFDHLSIASNTDGIERVRQDAKFAFILESPMAEFEVNRNCTLVTIGRHFKIGYYAFAFQISQGYQGVLSTAFQEYQQECDW